MRLREIPGYLDAVASEQAVRSSVLIGAGETICGIDVRPFTVGDLIRLQAIRSPFVCGGFISRTDCLRVLVMQSKGYRIPGHGLISRMLAKRANNRVLRRLRGTETSDLIGGINGMLDAAFMDAPASGESASDSAPIASSAAVMVDAIASEYAWPISEILNLELALVFQLFRLRHIANGGSRAALINRRSARVVGDYLRGLNERGSA